MARLSIDPMDNAASWQAFAADGTTPSVELTLLNDTRTPPGVGSTSARVQASAAASGHLLRRSLGAALDLSQLDELRLWLYSSRVADGSGDRPFFLELRLGSAALAPDAVGNKWHRYLPIMQSGSWEQARLSLNDLAPAVRGALTTLQLRCLGAALPFNCNLAQLIAVRDEMIGDVDGALHGALDGVLSIGGNPVPAVLHPANGTLSQTMPYIEITHYDVVFSRERTQSTRPRGDYTAAGYRIRPPSQAYELYYQITAVAGDRGSQAKMLELILRTLPPRGDLFVDGLPLPIESIEVDPLDQLGGARTDRIPLFYRVSTRQEVGTSDQVVGARTVIIDGDLRLPP